MRSTSASEGDGTGGTRPVRGTRSGRRWLRGVAAVALSTAATVGVGSGVGGAPLPAGPLGASQSQTWRVRQPACSMTQAWQKQPGALSVQSITFTGTVSCASVPSNLVVDAGFIVDDGNAEARSGLTAPPVVSATGSMGPSSSPESISLTQVFGAPRPGHDYDFRFGVSFIDTTNPWAVNGVSGTPPQCTENNPNGFPGDGPPTFTYPSIDCAFVQEVLVP